MTKKNPKKEQRKGVSRKAVTKTSAPKTLSSKGKKTQKKIEGSPKRTSKTVQSSRTTKASTTPRTKKTIKMETPKNGSQSPAGSKNRQKCSPREKKILDIRKKLLQQKNVLLSEAETALNSLPGQTIFPDLGDQASAEIDRNFMLRLRGREQRLLKKIEESIEKIESGSFGICESCGQEIDIKRLEARPVTTMCIYCKTEQEEEEKVRGQ